MCTLQQLLTLTLGLTSFASLAQPLVSATTAYSTLGPGDSYLVGTGWLINGSANPPEQFVGEAFAFAPTVSGNLSQVRLALGSGNGTMIGNLANVSLTLNSAANTPGTILERFPNVAPAGNAGFNNPLVSLASHVDPFLQAGSTYWLCVEPAMAGTDLVVNWNDQGLLASQAQEFSPGAWGAKGSKNTFAFDLQVVPIPEPSVAALGLLCLPLAFRARPQAKSATGKGPSVPSVWTTDRRPVANKPVAHPPRSPASRHPLPQIRPQPSAAWSRVPRRIASVPRRSFRTGDTLRLAAQGYS